MIELSSMLMNATKAKKCINCGGDIQKGMFHVSLTVQSEASHRIRTAGRCVKCEIKKVEEFRKRMSAVKEGPTSMKKLFAIH